MSRLAQLVNDAALRARVGDRGPKGVGLSIVADGLRRVLVRNGDPLIHYRIAGIDLEIPLSHELPFYRLAFPEYGANLGRLAAAVASKYPAASAIDIGANVGDTAAVMRGASFGGPILCIEGDDRFFRILERNSARIPGLHLERTLVGRSSESIEARLATGKGSGQVVESQGSHLRVESLEVVLARWPSLPPPRLVKTDTDGFDCAIIEGATATLAQLRPVLFFEYDPAYLPAGFEPARFFQRLQDIGYERALVYENRGDFMLSLRLGETKLLEEVHHFFSGRGHDSYADIALFQGADRDLADSFRESELAHFDRVRGVR